MRKRRVVISGVGAVSPFGWGVEPMVKGMAENLCALSTITEQERVGGMLASVAGKVPAYNTKQLPREYRRVMSHMSIMAFVAASEALRSANIEPSLPLAETYRNMGISVAGTISSPNTLENFFADFIASRSVETTRSTTFFKVMSHSVASNLAVAFGLMGRCLSPAAACASGLQAIGLAHEAIAYGHSKLMLCGGSEEFHPLLPATFDRIGAASHSPSPDTASKPFDAKRDGIVCSEGSGVLLLEEYEHAILRNAPILAEVTGFATNSSAGSIVSPDTQCIEACMRNALEDASINPEDVCLINAHATGTEMGDIAEGQAIYNIFKNGPRVNSLKGYMGHTMAASGALELIASLLAAHKGLAYGTRNLNEPEPRCGEINFLTTSKHVPIKYLLKNSFGLGGVNASLIIKLKNKACE